MPTRGRPLAQVTSPEISRAGNCLVATIPPVTRRSVARLVATTLWEQRRKALTTRAPAAAARTTEIVRYEPSLPATPSTSAATPSTAAITCHMYVGRGSGFDCRPRRRCVGRCRPRCDRSPSPRPPGTIPCYARALDRNSRGEPNRSSLDFESPPDFFRADGGVAVAQHGLRL